MNVSNLPQKWSSVLRGPCDVNGRGKKMSLPGKNASKGERPQLVFARLSHFYQQSSCTIHPCQVFLWSSWFWVSIRMISIADPHTSPSSSPCSLLHPPRHGVHIVSNQALPLPAQPHPPAAGQPGGAVVAGGRHQDGGGEVVRRTLPPWSSHWATGWLVITNYHFESFPALAWF